MTLIAFHAEDDVVELDGVKIKGRACDAACEACGDQLVLYESYDAEFCPTCNEWKAARCDDPVCIHCPTRPERPLPPRTCELP